MGLKIDNLHISVDNKKIIKGISLEINPSEIHVIMGPNGAGKSTLANTLMGHPRYEVTKGSIILDNKDITSFPPEKRAKLRLFLSPQYPPEVVGVTVTNFLRSALGSLNDQNQNPFEFHKKLIQKIIELRIDPEFAKRYLNVGFSGGEKKRLEMLQLAMLNPKYVILDETDSGLDIDALKIVAKSINNFHSPDRGWLIITHYNRILEYVTPNFVHILNNGQIVKSGGHELAKTVEESGYQHIATS